MKLNRYEFFLLFLIAGLIFFVFFLAVFNAKVDARDSQRIADITQIRSALKIYYQENGIFPAIQAGDKPAEISSYLDRWPQAPRADKNCSSAENSYKYFQKSSGLDYGLTFCLGQRVGNLNAGFHTANSKGVN